MHFAHQCEGSGFLRDRLREGESLARGQLVHFYAGGAYLSSVDRGQEEIHFAGVNLVVGGVANPSHQPVSVSVIDIHLQYLDVGINVHVNRPVQFGQHLRRDFRGRQRFRRFVLAPVHQKCEHHSHHHYQERHANFHPTDKLLADGAVAELERVLRAAAGEQTLHRSAQRAQQTHAFGLRLGLPGLHARVYDGFQEISKTACHMNSRMPAEAYYSLGSGYRRAPRGSASNVSSVVRSSCRPITIRKSPASTALSAGGLKSMRPSARRMAITITPTLRRNCISRMVFDTTSLDSETRTCSMLMSGPMPLVVKSRNCTTCGRSRDCASRWPVMAYGAKTESAPARRIFSSAPSSAARVAT